MSTKVARFALIATTAFLMAQPIVSAAPSKGQHEKSGVRILNFPGDIPDETCGSDSSSDPKCKNTVYRVQVFRVMDPRQKVMGCVAAFPYNSLRIRTTSNKEEAYVTWDLDSGANAQFVDPGVGISKRGVIGPIPSSYFDTPAIASGGQSVTVHFQKNKQHGKQFDHQPKVKLTDGDKNDCLGVDPTIGNSAN